MGRLLVGRVSLRAVSSAAGPGAPAAAETDLLVPVSFLRVGSPAGRPEVITCCHSCGSCCIRSRNRPAGNDWRPPWPGGRPCRRRRSGREPLVEGAVVGGELADALFEGGVSGYRSPGAPATGGQPVDHPQSEPEEEPEESEPAVEPVKVLTTEPPPSITDAVDAVLDALNKVDKARSLLGVALRAERAKTGISANELAERVRGAMSHLVLKALRYTAADSRMMSAVTHGEGRRGIRGTLRRELRLRIRVAGDEGQVWSLRRWLARDPGLAGVEHELSAESLEPGSMGGSALDVINVVVSNSIGMASLLLAVANWRASRNEPAEVTVEHDSAVVTVAENSPEDITRIVDVLISDEASHS